MHGAVMHGTRDVRLEERPDPRRIDPGRMFDLTLSLTEDRSLCCDGRAPFDQDAPASLTSRRG